MKKNNLIIILIVSVVVLLVGIIIIKNNNSKIKGEVEPLNQTNSEINQSVNSDTTQSITENINNIKIDDTTDQDLAPIDQELQKL